MVSPEGKGQGMFGMADRTQPWSEGKSPVSPPLERFQKKSWIQRLVNNLVLRFGLAGLAIASAGYAAYREIPAIHQAVNQEVDSLLHRGNSPEITVPTDPILLSGVESGSFSGSNLTQVTPEEIRNLPSFDEKGNLLLLFPISNLEPGESIYYEKALDRTTIWPQEILEKAIRENTKNFMILKNVPAGKEFNAFMSGRAFVIAIQKNEEFIPVGIRIEQMGQDGRLHSLSIALSLEEINNVQKGDLNIIIPAPIQGPDNSNGRQWEKGLQVERGTTPLFTTSRPFNIQVYSNSYFDGNFNNHPVPGNIVFLTGPSNSFKTIASK